MQTETGSPAAGSGPTAQPSDGTAAPGVNSVNGGGTGGGSAGNRNNNDGSGGQDSNGNGDGTNEGKIEVTGILTNEGVECRALRARNGQLYTLAGDTDRFKNGETVTVSGFRAEMSFCQQGTTINVKSIERAP